MRKKQCAKLCQQLLPHLPGYVYIDWTMYSRPLDHVMRGFSFDPSGFDRLSFYVWVFCLPLYVPTEDVHFTFGDRLRRGRSWKLDEEGLIDRLLEEFQLADARFLSQIRTPADFAENAHFQRNFENAHVLEAIAYSQIFAGESQRGLSNLNRLLGMLDARLDGEIRSRVEDVKARLDVGLVEARRLLETWESQTIQNLGLTDES